MKKWENHKVHARGGAGSWHGGYYGKPASMSPGGKKVRAKGMDSKTIIYGWWEKKCKLPKKRCKKDDQAKKCDFLSRKLGENWSKS